MLCKSISHDFHYPYHIWADDFIFVTRTIFELHIFLVLVFSTYILRMLCKSISWLHYPYHIWADDFIFVTRTIFELHIFSVLVLYPYWERYVNPISCNFITHTIFGLMIFIFGDSYHIRVTHILGFSILYPYWERYVNPYHDFITHTIFGRWFHLCDSYHIRVTHILGS